MLKKCGRFSHMVRSYYIYKRNVTLHYILNSSICTKPYRSLLRSFYCPEGVAINELFYFIIVFVNMGVLILILYVNSELAIRRKYHA